MRIATINVNGIRASLRKGLGGWIHERQPDVLCLQEVRAFPDDLKGWAKGPDGWHAYWKPAAKPGYSGVAILSRVKPKRVVDTFGDQLIDDEGRWLLAEYDGLAVASLYLPSGSHDEARQEVKYRCMDLLVAKLRKLKARGRQVVVAGDFNIAHTNQDIHNWRGNLTNSGFLPEEREWLGDLGSKHGWIDVYRHLHPTGSAYTWWSQRGGARDRDVGWRIDYQFATPGLAQVVSNVEVYREPRLSDHAPLVADYDFV